MVEIKMKMTPEAFALWRPDGNDDGPFADPVDHLDKVLVHSEFNNYVRGPFATVPVTHPAVAGVAASVSPTSGGFLVSGQIVKTSRNVLTHNLGYPPRFSIAVDGEVLPSGWLIQQVGNRGRIIYYSSNSTHIIVTDVGGSDENALPAIAKTYSVVAYRNIAAEPGAPQFKLTPDRLIAGQGKLDTNERHMRVALGGESPIWIPGGGLVDVAGGAFRTVTPKGTVLDQPGYNGSFAPGAASIQVTV